MGRNHARVLARHEAVDFVGVADPSCVGTVVEGHRVVASVHELTALSIDACVVAVPTIAHVAVGTALARAGVAALIEKPLALTVSECDELIAAFEQNGVPAAVGHIERYNPALVAMHDRLGSGQLGEIYQITTRRLGPFPNRVHDVGVVKDLATHDLDLTPYLLSTNYARVSAEIFARPGRDHEEVVAVTGRLADGTITNHLVNWLTPVKERTVMVTGERGCLVADTLTADLTFLAGGHVASEWPALMNMRGVTEAEIVRYAIAKREPLRLEIDNFVALVSGAAARTVPLAEGRRAVELAEAVISSAQRRQAVTLPAPIGPR